MRRGLAALLALAVTGSIVALSRAPYPTGEGRGAMLRLSWSGRPERIERCRELTDAELAERPAHMRRRLECEGRPARYLVRIGIDGAVASLDTVTGGGLRGDRAIHMLRELRLEPGRRAIAVEVARLERMEAAADESEDEDEEKTEAAPLDTTAEGRIPPDRATREREERRRQQQEALPAALVLDTSVTLAPGAVLLVTYDPSARRLAALTGSEPRQGD
jgi:hypothetical protein